MTTSNVFSAACEVVPFRKSEVFTHTSEARGYIQTDGRNRFSRSELLTTDTELIAMAPAANMGCSRPAAASGMQAARRDPRAWFAVAMRLSSA